MTLDRLVMTTSARAETPGLMLGSGSILIPQQAVSRDPKGNPLALVVDSAGKVVQRRLSLDRALGDQWLVASGLAAGEQVISPSTAAPTACRLTKTMPRV